MHNLYSCGHICRLFQDGFILYPPLTCYRRFSHATVVRGWIWDLNCGMTLFPPPEQCDCLTRSLTHVHTHNTQSTNPPIPYCVIFPQVVAVARTKKRTQWEAGPGHGGWSQIYRSKSCLPFPVLQAHRFCQSFFCHCQKHCIVYCSATDS